MRSDVKRNGWLIIGFAIIQCIIFQAIVHLQLIELDYSGRVAIYTVSTIACATLLFIGVLYMVVKGNPDHT